MDENGTKGLMVMIMLLVTRTSSSLEAWRGFSSTSFSTPHMPPSLHPLPLPARLLSFSTDYAGKHRMNTIPYELRKELKKCNRKCRKYYKKFKFHVHDRDWYNFGHCLRNCHVWESMNTNIGSGIVPDRIKIIAYIFNLLLLCNNCVIVVFTLVCDSVIVIFLK
jgi:hypothetical protein